jgi:hypothetical protein
MCWLAYETGPAFAQVQASWFDKVDNVRRSVVEDVTEAGKGQAFSIGGIINSEQEAALPLRRRAKPSNAPNAAPYSNLPRVIRGSGINSRLWFLECVTVSKDHILSISPAILTFADQD